MKKNLTIRKMEFKTVEEEVDLPESLYYVIVYDAQYESKITEEEFKNCYNSFFSKLILR